MKLTECKTIFDADITCSAACASKRVWVPHLSNLSQVFKSEDEEQNLTDSETPEDEDEKAAGSVIRSDKSHQLKLFYWACSELKWLAGRLHFIMAPVSACRRNCAQKQSNCRPQDTDVNGAFKPALTVVQESVCDVNRSFYCHWRLFCVGRKSQRLQKRSGEKNNANRKTWKVSEFTLCTLFNFTHKDRKTSQTQEQRKTTKWSIIFPAAEQNISLNIYLCKSIIQSPDILYVYEGKRF